MFGIQKFKSGNYKVVMPVLSEYIRDDLTCDYGHPITASLPKDEAFRVASELNKVLASVKHR